MRILATKPLIVFMTINQTSSFSPLAPIQMHKSHVVRVQHSTSSAFEERYKGA